MPGCAMIESPDFRGTTNDDNCPARRSARAHVGRILLSRAGPARDRAAGMALEDGGWKEMLFQGRQAPPAGRLAPDL